jgi:hypothetical protein
MLSEMTASRVAFTDNPATPAFSDDERLMYIPHLDILNQNLVSSIRAVG